jgi:hypothetical protein
MLNWRVMSLKQRIYSDYFMPSRIKEYEAMLKKILDLGYSIVDEKTFLLVSGQVKSQNFFILRHDIDSDLAKTKKMFEVETNLGIKSSYFFRLSTFNLKIIEQIAARGNLVGYHYEEIATFIKRKRIRTTASFKREFDIRKCQDDFQINLMKLRKMTGLPLEVAASHGDFTNRKFGVYNWELLNSDIFRTECGIELEVYDQTIRDFTGKNLIDKSFPQFWYPNSPIECAEKNQKVIYTLVHPRHWGGNIVENFFQDFTRAKEELEIRFFGT